MQKLKHLLAKGRISLESLPVESRHLGTDGESRDPESCPRKTDPVQPSRAGRDQKTGAQRPERQNRSQDAGHLCAAVPLSIPAQPHTQTGWKATARRPQPWGQPEWEGHQSVSTCPGNCPNRLHHVSLAVTPAARHPSGHSWASDRWPCSYIEGHRWMTGKTVDAGTSTAGSWRGIGYMVGGHRSAAWIASTRGMPALPALPCSAGGLDGSPHAVGDAAAGCLCARMRAGSGGRRRAAGPDAASCASRGARLGERPRRIRCRHGQP